MEFTQTVEAISVNRAPTRTRSHARTHTHTLEVWL